jgi:hypothetical protein
MGDESMSELGKVCMKQESLRAHPIDTLRYNFPLFIILLIFSLLLLECSKNPTITQKTVSQEDALLKKLKQAMDYTNPVTRDFAIKFASQSPGNYNYGQICCIFDYLYKNWKYVNDPRGFDYFASASETITSNLSGDCDDFAILIDSLISSIGGITRISLVYSNSSGHAFAEVYIGKVSDGVIQNALKNINSYYQDFFQKLFGVNAVTSIWYRTDSNNGVWLNLD